MATTELKETLALRLSLYQGIIQGPALKQMVENSSSFPGTLAQMAIRDKLISLPHWRKCWQTATEQPNWPDHPKMVGRENQLIYQKLRESQILVLAELNQAYQRLAQNQTDLRLHEFLIQHKGMNRGDVYNMLDIQDRQRMFCPACRLEFDISPHYPWLQYPCLFCQNRLQTSLHRPAPVQRDSVEETGVIPQPENGAPMKTFGRYQIRKQLGEGGMGAVYLAYDPEMDRDVALKVVTEQPAKDDQIYQRFQREVSLAARLNHPHIVPLYDYGEFGGIPYYTMSYVPGENLRDLVERKKRLSPKKAIEYAVQIGQAIACAHEEDVLHRDIKPENIMIDNEGRALLMDFGLAKELGGNSDMGITRVGTIVGSPEFMSPEQARGDVDIDKRTDIYALGGVVFFMLTGRGPFYSLEVMDLLFKVMNDDPPRLAKLNPAVNSDLDRVVDRCLAKSPEDRYPHTGDLVDDLTAISEGRPIAHHSPKRLKKAVRYLSRHPLITFGIVAVILALLGVVIGRQLAQRKVPPLPVKKTDRVSENNTDSPYGNPTGSSPSQPEKHTPPPATLSPAEQLSQALAAIDRGEQSPPRSPLSLPRPEMDKAFSILIGWAQKEIGPAGRVAWQILWGRKSELTSSQKQQIRQFLASTMANHSYIDHPIRGKLYIAFWREFTRENSREQKKMFKIISDQLVKHCKSLLDKRNYKRAIPWAQWANQLYHRGLAYYYLGMIYMNLKDYTRSQKHLEMCLQSHPWWPEVYSYLGLIYMRNKQSMKSVVKFSQAIAMNPRGAGNFFHRGQAYSMAGKPYLSITSYQQCARMQPKLKKRCHEAIQKILKKYGRDAVVAQQKKLATQVKELTQLLKSSRPTSEKIAQLKKIKAHSTTGIHMINELAGYLGHDDKPLRLEVGRTLARIGVRSLRAMMTVFSKGNSRNKFLAMQVCASMGTKARPMLEVLKRAYQKSTVDVKKEMVFLVAYMGKGSIWEKRFYRIVGRDKEWSVRKRLATVLGRNHYEKSFRINRLITLLRDKHPQVRLQAALVLEKKFKQLPQNARLALEKASRDQVKAVREAAARALNK